MDEKDSSIEKFEFLECDETIDPILDSYKNIIKILNHNKRDIDKKLLIIENIDLKSEILDYKIRCTRYEFDQKMAKIDGTKNTTLGFTGLSASQLSLKMIEIEQQITAIKNENEDELLILTQKKLELQETVELLNTEMDQTLNLIKTDFGDLLATIENDPMSGLISGKLSNEIEAWRQEIERLSFLQDEGWKLNNPDFKLLAILEARGLKETKPGLLITKSYTILTFDEAVEKGYFQGLDLSLDFPLEFMKKTTVGDDVASTGSSRDESSKEASSLFSQMSSEDVHYLKQTVGTPLTLALAEITTVQPRDPIHYLGHYLFKYRYNEEITRIQKKELEQLNAEREVLAEKRRKLLAIDVAKRALSDILRRMENEIYLKELEAEMRLTQMGEG